MQDYKPTIRSDRQSRQILPAVRPLPYYSILQSVEEKALGASLRIDFPAKKTLLMLLITLLTCMSSCTANKEDREPSIVSWTVTHSGDADFIPQARAKIDSAAAAGPDSLEQFVRQIADALCASGRENLAISVAAYPHGIDLKADDRSEIGRRLLIQLQLSGRPAPALPLQPEAGTKGAIVLFFESDCAACHAIVDRLKASYHSLQPGGIRIISIASDRDKERYAAYARTLPWPDKYCDYRSFEGDCFKAWGVAATPTVYYVDEKGTVQREYGHLEDLLTRAGSGQGQAD